MTNASFDRAQALARAKSLYDARDRAGLAQFASEVGQETFCDLHDGQWLACALVKDFVRPDVPAQELDLEILDDLARLGVTLDPVIPDLMEAIIEQDSAEGLAFLRKTLGCTEPFGTYLTLSWTLRRCGPSLAEEIAQEVDGLPDKLISEGTRFYSGILPDYCLGAYQPKEFAVLLTARCDIRPVFEAADLQDAYGAFGPNVRRLIDATGSNHGQIRLRELEPSLASIIARDPLGSFYGLDEETLHRELSVGGFQSA